MMALFIPDVEQDYRQIFKFKLIRLKFDQFRIISMLSLNSFTKSTETIILDIEFSNFDLNPGPNFDYLLIIQVVSNILIRVRIKLFPVGWPLLQEGQTARQFLPWFWYNT